MHVHRWDPASPPRAAVQIAHGLAEHGGRYARLAQALNAAGYVVYANDHRGHGRTATTAADLGFFGENEGWLKSVGDLDLLRQRIAVDHPALPIVLLGHSMGSFLARQYASEKGDTLAGLVLSGSDGAPSPLARAGRWVVRLERLLVGSRGKSALIHALSIGAFNKSFQSARTPFDWLSRDPEAVDAYLADPLCGFRPTVQLWIDVLDAFHDISRPERVAAIPKELPIYIISGGNDPVSADGRGVQRLLAGYLRAGLTGVSHRIYPGARHELFHETNRAEVVHDLIAWLDQTIKPDPHPQAA